MMDIRMFLVGLALILLCVGPAKGAGLGSTSILVSDNIIDGSNVRQVEIGIRITTTSDQSNPAVCGVPSVDGTSPFVVSITPACGGTNPCTQICTLTTTSIPGCTFDGTFTLRYQICDAVTTTPASDETAVFTLQERSVCTDSIVSIAANISSFGAYADAQFSATKSHYFINDMVYFPFRVTYQELTISTLTFNTITVQSDTSATAVLYSSANTGIGSAVKLETSALTSQLESGSTTMWFAVQLNREEGSPFASTPSSVTSYTFNVVFDVTYKNAKRALHQLEGGQLYSKSTIMVHNKPELQVAPVQEVAPNSGYILSGGIVGVMSSLVVLLFGF